VENENMSNFLSCSYSSIVQFVATQNAQRKNDFSSDEPSYMYLTITAKFCIIWLSSLYQKKRAKY